MKVQVVNAPIILIESTLTLTVDGKQMNLKEFMKKFGTTNVSNVELEATGSKNESFAGVFNYKYRKQSFIKQNCTKGIQVRVLV